MAKLETDISQLLRKYQALTGKLPTIGTAESATGGRISDKITNIPGSSDYFKGSIIAYGNEIKINVLGVKKETLENYGAVSHQTAKEMAEGGRNILKVDICISDTGIAGPAGATPEKPVGLFYIGLANARHSTSREHRFRGNREKNKEGAAKAALGLLKEHLLDLIKEETPRNLEEKHVVTCFLEHDRKILILRRSQKVSTYQGQWAGVSGYIETSNDQQASTEITEETGLAKEDIQLLKKGKPLEVVDESLNRKWIVHPFLFHVKTPQKIKIDWEHKEAKWINASEITRYETVPGLAEALNRVIDKLD